MSNSFISLIERTLTGATTPRQSGSGSNGSDGVLRITGASPSDDLISYPGHSLLGVSYPSAEMQSVYSPAPADWAEHVKISSNLSV